MSSGAGILVFGFGTLLLFAVVYFFFDRIRRTKSQNPVVGPFSITFARLFGLITVAVLGAALALMGKDQQFATSAFTLLGTIAGYLAGAKATPGTAGSSGTPDSSAGSATDSASEEHL